MAIGDRLLDIEGNQILDADGNVFLSDGSNDDCCCQTTPFFCSGCTGTGPNQMKVILAGLTVCAGCIALGGGSWAKLNGDPNGEYILDNLNADDPTNTCCGWGTFSSAITVSLYSDSGCTILDPSVSPNPKPIQFVLDLCNDPFFGPSLFFFAATDAVAIFNHDNLADGLPCIGPVSGITNDIVTCGAFAPGQALAFGGTMRYEAA